MMGRVQSPIQLMNPMTSPNRFDVLQGLDKEIIVGDEIQQCSPTSVEAPLVPIHPEINQGRGLCRFRNVLYGGNNRHRGTVGMKFNGLASAVRFNRHPWMHRARSRSRGGSRRRKKSINRNGSESHSLVDVKARESFSEPIVLSTESCVPETSSSL
ncbi:hypothetical protein FRX31_018545 [Thalictrum thalictroides]|uniref:Uncharacterized protein n=1 Tax=Thalictrum thalictroides TaxID=46969 RepID=A0A7J6W4Y7_THATH|nr:hypothetical protein FRX31_018545 [Thalictrum thalictroides]